MKEAYEPTPHLRFVKRWVVVSDVDTNEIRCVRILQQLWVDRGDLSFFRVEYQEHYESAFQMQHEWRDVPEAEEE